MFRSLFVLFILIVGMVRAQFTLVETGGTFRSDATDLAIGGTAFASGLINGDGYGVHTIAGLNNGSYGNSSSWIGSGPSDAGVLISSSSIISSFAFGRDNTGTYADRNAGTYNFYYTTDSGLNSGNALSANWTSLGSLNYTSSPPASPSLRHLYNLTSPVSSATGFRIASADGTAIDEIELYATFAVAPPPQPGVSNLAGTPLGTVYRSANQFIAQSFITDSSSAQFQLSMVTLPIVSGSGMTDFTVQIRNDLSGGPGSLVGTLTGSTSPTNGPYDFVNGSMLLDASTTYWVTWGASSGDFGSPQMTGNMGSGDWALGNYTNSYNDGANWYGPSSGYSYQISIQGISPVPEPSTYALLFGALIFGFVAWHRRRS
ncbi:MAG: PEP-CTERM sorting domain-containing protein [Opitutaceae bacterium]|nr:PEP-CTERM sorting domain-containing protein [Opitutaceae bacterium]MBP9912821.1 PEP-CTERM sorting domain-containing protein [Opitutaceae bacterium]